MTKLKTLIANGGMCSINNNSIINCTNIEELDISYNKKITDINCLTKLKKTSIIGCNIPNTGIMNCTNIEILKVYQN